MVIIVINFMWIRYLRTINLMQLLTWLLNPVDRSIKDPLGFAKTNILGTLTLLDAFKALWQNNWHDKRFYHSTDEVYGTLGDKGLFTENSPFIQIHPIQHQK